MTDNELLLAISDMLDKKLDAKLAPIENRVKRIEVELLENNVIPRLNTIEKFFGHSFLSASIVIDEQASREEFLCLRDAKSLRL